jgi:hypothetical protein
MKGIIWGLLVILSMGASAPLAVAEEHRWVEREAILEAMQQVQGFDPTQTTNAARFDAEVFYLIARKARDEDPSAAPLLIEREDWFQAYLTRAGLSPEEAPPFARKARDHGQFILLDHRPDRVFTRIKDGPEPEFVLNVLIWWPEHPDGPDRFSYLDTLSDPDLKVTNRSVVSYRLLYFKDWTAQDEVSGVYGRPVDGALGALFDVIGDGQVKFSRMAVSEDGLLLMRARAEKGIIGVTQTVVVRPDGQSEKDVPKGRDDLKQIERTLKTKLKVDYVPLGDPPSDVSRVSGGEE